MKKVALITGGNRGIGKGFCQYLTKHGYQVYAGVRTPGKEQEDIREVHLDLQDDRSIARAIATIEKEQGQLDLLVANAGLNKDTATGGRKELVATLDHLDRSYLLNMFEVNVVGQLMLIKAAVPLMTKDDCFIVTISSDRASFHDEYENSTANYGYRASKVALNMATYCLTYDLPKNIRTFAVHPGDVLTDMNPRGTMEPIDSAAAICSIMKNWRGEYNGMFLRYDGTLYPL